MRQYEVTFIVDPVLSSDEVKATVKVYSDLLKDAGCEIVHVDELGLRQLAYPINRRNTGVYFTIEFRPSDGNIIDNMELSFRRDERIMRFLVVRLDKYGVKYNEDKRKGLIGKVKKKEEKKDERGSRRHSDKPKSQAPKKEESPKPVAEEKPAVEEKPVVKEETPNPVAEEKTVTTEETTKDGDA